ncbi:MULTISPECIES: hypothetical protein [Mesorhizobium]|uniref:hypothetical protein n=1 Tax=Mesorhizobium TaxID=68287 RepID=UPI000486CFA1|nr:MULTISPECIES: hypothetical protein [Mesorhizobium]MCF6117247.1 hypothetical protein [Mesorhizobium muleiense]RWP09255.1 MAG: hypothetical protein EOQ99_03005 [Mesorhizobium sp.]RWP18092.1 MAG: hypothetical protein EOR00_11985 [Mesorhizobium sp.]RWP20631.1 MAG: hypothetical protein EOR01_17955 [Mesorhizobium sp.]RWP31286.1 MAG: hypothetical protein EOR02_10475 [Mesorhizobium sp.]
MNRTKPIIVLALLLAAQTAANADSRIAKFCSPGPMDDRAMFTAIAVTIHLTNQGKLIRLPHVKPMTSMAECRAWTHQQEFMRVLPGYLATFHYCDCASEP